jgi:hypothetical protein
MSDDKKILVDEDWKSRVAAEKEAVAREPQSTPTPTAATSGEPASAGGRGAEFPPMPPASFEMLVTTLATEAMIGLGQIPHPMTGKVHADASQARYAIDMLKMLSEKTKGNLTPGEERGMRDLLHQLRMAFVATRSAGVAAAAEAVQGAPSPLAES